MRSFQCAICGKATPYSQHLPELFPFCSERCKLIDLGKWLREEYGAEYHGSSEPDSEVDLDEIGPADDVPTH